MRIEMELRATSKVLGRSSDLREVLTNLIFNAVDAMPLGGTLTLATAATADGVELRVTDTGTGMAEEVRVRCLEPFFTTKGDKGTGLGLSMVYGILRRHEADLTIDSTPGQGTTFRIRFRKEAARERDAVAPTIRQLRRKRILVAEDEEAVRELLATYLSRDGHSVELAVNGRDAAARVAAEKFDIVITDRAMSGMSGDQLAAIVKTLSPETPVLLVTGFGALMNSANEKPAGVDLVLAKPITHDALRAALVALVGH